MAPGGFGDKHLGIVPEEIEAVQLVQMDQRTRVANDNLGDQLIP